MDSNCVLQYKLVTLASGTCAEVVVHVGQPPISRTPKYQYTVPRYPARYLRLTALGRH